MWRNRRWYILILLLAIYLSIFYKEYHISLLMFLMVFLPIITLICVYFTKKNITVDLVTKKKVVPKGKSVEIEMVFKNSFLFPASRIGFKLAYKNQFSMNKKEKMYSVFVRGHAMQKIVCEVCPDYCGNLEFEITKIRVYDILGVWNFKIPNTHTLHVAVLPEMTEIADAMLKGGVEGFLEDEIYSNKRSGDDPSEIFRIREYLDGDKLNRIHWKLSAKEGALMVKDFGLPLDSSVVILLELYDLGEETEKIIDASIETAVSLSLQFIYLGQMHFIAWYDLYIDDIVRVRIQDEGDLYQALAKLFISDIYTQELQGLVAYQCRYRTEQYSNLFYITSLTKGNEMYRIREFARFSNCHITFITDSQEISPELKENLIESELVYSFVSPEQLYTDINKLTITVQE